VKTPAPERPAGRKRLAAKGHALADGTAPVPDVAYLRKAIRAKGRVDPAKWPALKRLIVRRARQLKATGAPGVKGTWPFQGANNDSEAIDLAAMTRRMPMVRGAADVQMARTGPGVITVRHKSSGMKVGTITPSGHGYQATHADGTATGASGSQQGALSGLITHHNKRARGFPPAAEAKAYAGDSQAVDLAGALPFTSAATSTDGPRVTSASAGKPTATVKPAGGLSPYAAAIYRKFIAKGMKPAVAMGFAKRADVMHAKASAA
jgi:hypothetical protein